jgi:hypothetical protein
MKIISGSSIIILLGSLTMFAQSPMPPPPYGDYQQPVQSLEVKWAEIQSDLRRNQHWATTESRIVTKGLLAPSANDRLNSAAFLRTPDTGLILLLPARVLDEKVLQAHKELRILGAGSFYSFADHTHAIGYASDVRLENGNLNAGFPIHLGVIRELGDVPLEDLTLDDPRVEFLSAYQSPRTLETAQAEAARFRQGVQLDGAIYRSEVPIQVNSTFLLRSITYRFIHGSDVLVALRVLRKDDDGSVTIAWKRLKKYRAPKPRRSFYRPVQIPQIQKNKWPTR